jgi:ABC-2 type transport system ATP-binding protein
MYRNELNHIHASKLTKVYKSSFGKRKVNALQELDLTIPQGTIFGLLGPNGAGKTTLIKILLGITYPTAGTAALLGEDIKNYTIRKKIGYLPENHKFPLYLNGEEVLRYFGRLSGADSSLLDNKIDELLTTVKLINWKKNKIKTYSKGMMQRLGLAQALINNPELVFLDEPTDGVDPIGRIEIREILLKLKEQGKTIFLNSHLLSETEMVCDRVGILNKGKLIRESTVRELTERTEEYLIRTGSELPDGLFPFTRLPDGSYNIRVKDIDELNRYIDLIRQNGIIIREVIQQKNTLENMFVEIIKREGEGSI